MLDTIAPIRSEDHRWSAFRVLRPGSRFRLSWSHGWRGDPYRRRARQTAGELSLVRDPASGAGLGDPINPAAFFLGRGQCQPKLLFKGSQEHPADSMTLPAGGAGDLIDGYTLGSSQHCDHLVLL